MNNISNIVFYNDGELELKVSVNEDTIWLTQSQMSELFDTSTDNIGLHLKNIYKEKELNENSTTENYSVVHQEGNRKVTRIIKHYNLDAIICVGYRVSSSKATKFLQWATSISKQLKLDFEKYSKQYDNITIKIFKNSHDRFLIIDNYELFHLGASLKDLGKKWFAFLKMNLDINEVLKKLD